MVGEQHHRLRQARIAAGFERQADVTKRFEAWNANTYKSNENGSMPFSYERARDYAKAFGVRAEWLYAGEGAMRVSPDGNTVPLVGYVSAGAQAHYYGDGDGELDRVQAPDTATPATVAVEVRGTSLGPLFERWLIFYDDVRTPVTPDLLGRLCVVGLPDDRVLVKKIMAAKTPGYFHLLSNTEPTMNDQEVLWAARVRSMVPH